MHMFISQGALEIEGELLCFVGTLACERWLHITSGITSPVCHQPNTGRAKWNIAGTGINRFIHTLQFHYSSETEWMVRTLSTYDLNSLCEN